MENLGAIRKSKGAQCNLGSILICIFLYVLEEFPSFGKVNWKSNKSAITQINEYIEKMGDNFEPQMTSYFKDFKKSMKQRSIIPLSLVEQHINDIYFIVSIDHTYIQATFLRVRWLRPLGYELDIDEASTVITVLLAKEIDKIVKPFGIYDVVKSKVEMDLKTTSMIKRKDKLVRKLKKRFGEGIEGEIGAEE